MLCQFERLLYPRDSSAVAIDSYMIALYRPLERILDSNGMRVTQVKAVGYGLPTASSLSYDIKGHWNKSAKHGVQFEMETYDEVIAPDKEGVIAYLSSGQIKGIGPKLAERIYAAFGNNTLEILDKDPDKLLIESDKYNIDNTVISYYRLEDNIDLFEYEVLANHKNVTYELKYLSVTDNILEFFNKFFV